MRRAAYCINEKEIGVCDDQHTFSRFHCRERVLRSLDECELGKVADHVEDGTLDYLISCESIDNHSCVMSYLVVNGFSETGIWVSEEKKYHPVQKGEILLVFDDDYNYNNVIYRL